MAQKSIGKIAIGVSLVAAAGLGGKALYDRQATPAPAQTTAASASATGNRTFMFLSDIHLGNGIAISEDGFDTGLDLWAAFKDKVDSIVKQSQTLDFIIYTGDLPEHNDGYELRSGSQDWTDHKNDNDSVLIALQNLAVKYAKPVFYLPGNNDALAGDYRSFADRKHVTPLDNVTSSNLFFPGSNVKPGGTPPCMISNPHPELGFYSAYPIANLRLIALNTVMYTRKFTVVDGSNPTADGDSQMVWLAGQLADAQAKKEKVYIAMHVPPGKDAYISWGGVSDMWEATALKWQNKFLRLVETYDTTIAGILYGHTHMEELRELYDSTGTVVKEVAISCPGITPIYGNNPGFKVVTYNTADKELMDFTTYFTHIPFANPTGAKWGNNSYTFQNSYGCPAGTSIYQWISKMDTLNVINNSTLIYTVKNGPPNRHTNVGVGIPVRRQ